jgi:hypothetical protein
MNDFELGFQNNKCLEHFHCYNDICDKFVRSCGHNEDILSSDSFKFPL